MTPIDGLLSLVLLSPLIWALVFLLPRARRAHDTFGIVCSLLMALIALLGWLLIGPGIHSG